MSDSSEVDVSDTEEIRQNEVVDKDEESDEEITVTRKRKNFINESDESEDSDFDDDEDDEDEEEYLPQSSKKNKPKKKKRRLVAQFINEDVEVDTDDEEEEYEYDDEGDIGVDPREREEAERYMREQDQRRSQRTRFADMSEDQMAEYFRVRHEVNMAAISGNEDYISSIAQNGLLPDTHSPNLYIVKCRMGSEKALCTQLMRKFISFSKTAEPLEIKSVVIKDDIKGMIYIEANKIQQVVKAIQDVKAASVYRIKMVPKNEMVDTLKIVKAASKKSKGEVSIDRDVFAPGDTVEVTEGELINLFGKIISIDGDIVHIQPEHDELKGNVAVSLREIRKTFKLGNQVLVTNGRYKDVMGIIVRVEEDLAFLISADNNEEIKVPCRDLRLTPDVIRLAPKANGNRHKPHQMVSRGDPCESTPTIEPRENSYKPREIIRPNEFGKVIIRPRKKSFLIGKYVRIKAGPLKAHYGIVKDDTETTVNVELHALCKTIQVDKSRIEVVNGDAGTGTNYRDLARTPNESSRTPSYSSFQTPMYGSRTPDYGSRTPHYGGQTPGYEGSGSPSNGWDPAY